MVEGLRSRVASLAEHNRRLEHLLRELRRAMFAKKSEKLHPDQLQVAFEALEGALAEAEEQAAASPTPTPRAKRPDARRNLGHLPEHLLPRIEQVLEPDSTRCPCGCGEMARIGEDRTERLDIVPAQLRVIVTVRPKYACRVCEEGVTQAPAPAHLIEGGLPTEGMLAHVMVSKFADHLPLYRQAQIYARSGIDVHRSTLALWVGKGSFELRPVYECLKGELKTSNNLGLDETTVRVLDPGRGKTKTGYMWTMARDERGWSGPDPPGVVYEYAPGRSGKHGEKLLEGFEGTVQVDGYPGHNRLRREDRPGGALALAACWVHARRGLKEVFDSNASLTPWPARSNAPDRLGSSSRIRMPSRSRKAIAVSMSEPEGDTLRCDGVVATARESTAKESAVACVYREHAFTEGGGTRGRSAPPGPFGGTTTTRIEPTFSCIPEELIACHRRMLGACVWRGAARDLLRQHEDGGHAPQCVRAGPSQPMIASSYT